MSDQQRSPRYPSTGLASAMKSARLVWSKEKRTAVHMEVLAKALGYSGLNGKARNKISSMRQYGLLEKHGSGYRISELAMKTIHSVDGSEDLRAAIQEAALAPELFKQLAQSHAEGSFDAIKSFLILKKGFSEGGAITAAKAYKDTLAFASLNGEGYTTDETAPEDDDEGLPDEGEEPVVIAEKQADSNRIPQTVPAGVMALKPKEPTALLTQALVVSIPRNFRVDINVRGDELKREDLAKIKSQFNRWIEGLEEAFEE